MIVSVPLAELLTELLREANEGAHETVEAAAEQPITFIAPQIDIQLICSVVGGKPIEIAPSNATMSNYYRTAEDGLLKIQLKLKPGRI